MGTRSYNDLYSVVRVPIAATGAHHVHGRPHIFIANGVRAIQLYELKMLCEGDGGGEECDDCEEP